MNDAVVAGNRIRADGGQVERETYTVIEAGKKLGVGRDAAYQAVREGSIPSIRIGHRILVPRAALDRLLAGEAA